MYIHISIDLSCPHSTSANFRWRLFLHVAQDVVAHAQDHACHHGILDLRARICAVWSRYRSPQVREVHWGMTTSMVPCVFYF